MARKILQDVLPPGTRSIRRIPIERESELKKVSKKLPDMVSLHTIRSASKAKVQEHTRGTLPTSDEGVMVGRKKNYSRAILWTIAVISSILLFVAISFIFSHATVEVTPRSESVVIANTFIAKKDALLGELGYALMTLSKDGEEVVAGSPGKKIEKYAIGNIILYNNFNSTTRRFVAGTRFLAGNGKVYKLQSSVSVPGRKVVAGKIVPGSIQARVYAEKPGVEYNIKTSDLAGDFKVVAFAGDPQYEAFYGRQKTDIIGGLVSTTFIVKDSVTKVIREKIRENLKQQIFKEALAQKPIDFVLYQDDLLYTFESLPLVSRGTSTVAITERVVFNAVLFRKDLLARVVASSTSKSLINIPVEARGLDSINFTLKNNKEGVSPATNQFTFTLNGTSTFISKIVPEKISKDLLGKSRKEFGNIISTHREVYDGSATISPFWRFTFPDSLEKVRVMVKAID